MKVCVVSTPVFAVNSPNGTAGYSGLEVIAWHQAKGLAERGHQVALVAPEGSDCPGVEIIPCGPAGTWDETHAYSTYWQRLPEFDAVVDHSWMKWSYMLKAEGRLPQPILGVMHAPVDTMYRVWPPKFPGTEQIVAGRAVCISEDQASHFRAIHGRAARVIHNGIDVNFYQPLGVPRTDRFLFLARFSTIKGPDVAIEAAKEAGVELDLVGDTSITNEPEFLERCKRMTDGKRIRFVGPATRGECVWWFSQARAMLHPNLRFREPFGLAPVEANACGCPVIAWDHGAMRETMGEGDVLVNDHAQLVQAIKVLAERKNDPETLRRNAIRFSVERMAERCESLVRSAIGGEAW